MNPEILKQLLDGLIDAEALNQEEISAVERQIVELEGRIEDCRGRLSIVAQDKDKVLAMRQRYLSDGVSSGQAQPPSDQEPLKQAAVSGADRKAAKEALSRQAKAPAAKAEVPLAQGPAQGKAGQASASSSAPAPAAQRREASPARPLKLQPAVAQQSARPADNGSSEGQSVPTSPSPPFKVSAESVDEPVEENTALDVEDLKTEKSDDDTVRSINDALRGLFR